MSITQKDYLLRLMEAFAEGLSKCSALTTKGRKQEALCHLKATANSIFGTSLSMLDALDSQSAADMLVDAVKVEIYAGLVQEEAEILALLGDQDQAKAGHVRALELFLERTRMSPCIDEETRKRIGMLCIKIESDRLDERYSSLLQGIIRS